MKVGAVYQQTEPDTSPIWLFEHVFGDDKGYLTTFTGRQARLDNLDARHNELTAIQQRFYRYPASAKLAAKYLLEASQRERDAYYGVHLYRKPGNRLADNSAPTVRALWLDEDEGRYPEDGPGPTAIIQSSAGRRHLYWQLAQPVAVEWAVEMNRRLAVWAEGDSGKTGLSSVLRVPGTQNFKRHPQVDTVSGVLTGVEPWEPAALEQAIPPLPESLRNKGNGLVEDYDGPPLDLFTDYIEPSGTEVMAEIPDSGGVKFAIVCPWVDEHSGGDRTGTFLGQFASGAVWFFCHHTHCQGRGLQEFKDKTFPKGRIRLRIPKLGRSRTSGRVVIHLAW